MSLSIISKLYLVSLAFECKINNPLKAYLNWPKCLPWLSMITHHDYSRPAWLAFHGWCNTNKIISISVFLPKEANASRGGNVAAPYSSQFCQQTLLMETQLKRLIIWICWWQSMNQMEAHLLLYLNFPIDSYASLKMGKWGECILGLSVTQPY